MTALFVSRFELLLQEEEALSLEIIAFDKKLDSWTTLSKQPQATACMSGILAGQQRKPDTDRTPPPVLAFEVSSYVLCKCGCSGYHNSCCFVFSDSSSRLGAIKEGGMTMTIKHSSNYSANTL